MVRQRKGTVGAEPRLIILLEPPEPGYTASWTNDLACVCVCVSVAPENKGFVLNSAHHRAAVTSDQPRMNSGFSVMCLGSYSSAHGP